jgi:elongation factor P--beta-lysine ligase
MLAFLRHRCVVDHQHRIAAADEFVSLDEKFCFQRRRIPDASGNKMMQLIT